MNASMIAAQERRLIRLAELNAIPEATRTYEERGLILFLVRVVKADAARHGGEYRRNR